MNRWWTSSQSVAILTKESATCGKLFPNSSMEGTPVPIDGHAVDVLGEVGLAVVGRDLLVRRELRELAPGAEGVPRPGHHYRADRPVRLRSAPPRLRG